MLSFSHKRGLMQGDPVVPYLFNLLIEFIASDIQNEVLKGTSKPITLNRGGVRISHVDELTLFGEATEQQARNMMNCLNKFSTVFGLTINLSKL